MRSKLPLLPSGPGGVRKSTFHGPWPEQLSRYASRLQVGSSLKTEVHWQIGESARLKNARNFQIRGGEPAKNILITKSHRLTQKSEPVFGTGWTKARTPQATEFFGPVKIFLVQLTQAAASRCKLVQESLIHCGALALRLRRASRDFKKQRRLTQINADLHRSTQMRRVGDVGFRGHFRESLHWATSTYIW